MNLRLKIVIIWYMISVLILSVLIVISPENALPIFALIIILLIYGCVTYYINDKEERDLAESTSELENTKEYAKKVHLSKMYEDC